MDKLNSRIPKTPVPIQIHEQLVKRFGPEYTLENMVLWLLEREQKRMEEIRRKQFSHNLLTDEVSYR